MTTSGPSAREAGTPLAPSTAAPARPVTVLIEPASWKLMRDGFFDSGKLPTGGDDLQAPWRHLKQLLEARGLGVHTSDFLDELPRDSHKLFISVSGLSDYAALARRPDVTMSAYIALECPAVEPEIYRRLPRVRRHFRRVLSWSDTESLLPYTRRPVDVARRFCWPQSFDRVHEPQWQQRERPGFLVMINSNKLPRLYVNELYTRRLAAVEYFNRFGEVDLYGPNWGSMPNRVGKSWVPFTVRRLQRVLWEKWQRIHPDPIYKAAAEAHRGIAKSKADTLSRYRFALCFENQVVRGWMTEKIFDCFYAGTVPVYWGAPDVGDFVPAESFVDMRQFRDFGELRTFLHALSPAAIDRYREAGRAFVESERFAPFRRTTFSSMLADIVAEDLPRG